MSKNWGREEETPFAGAPPILGRSVARSVTRSRLGQPKTAGPRCRSVGAAITVDCVFENWVHPKWIKMAIWIQGNCLSIDFGVSYFRAKPYSEYWDASVVLMKKSALLTLPSLSQWGDDSQRWWNMVESSVKPWSRHWPVSCHQGFTEWWVKQCMKGTWVCLKMRHSRIAPDSIR